MTAENSSAFLFDDVRVEPATFRAFKAGHAIQLEPKAFRLLLFLIENRGRLIEKEEILENIWNGTHVTENALAREIAKLRKTLGDDPKAARYIQTVHTRGYRFVAEVTLGNGEAIRAGEDSKKISETGPPASSTITRAHSPKILSIRVVSLGVAAIVFLGLTILVGSKLWNRGGGSAIASRNSAIPSVAVLPFRSSGPNKDEEYLGMEIADALTAKLSSSKQLSVVPMTTVLHFAGKELDPSVTTVGNLLKADYVLSGEIDTSRHRMTAHLIRVQDGASLFGEDFDEKFEDVFQIEDSLCVRVLNNLMITVRSEEIQRSRRRYTENQEAYKTFLKAHYVMNKPTKEGILRCIDYFRQAIDLDPKYAMAYAGLSDCYMRLGRFGVAPAEFIPKSRSAVMKALELDETVPYAHSMLGRIAFQYDWDFARAGREFARARELDPTVTHAWFAAYLMALNHVAEAEVEYKRFEDFLPYLPGNTSLAQFFYLTRQYDSAVDLLNRKLEMNSNYPASHAWLGLVYEQQGRSRQAIDEFQKAIELSGGDYGLGALGHIHAVLGNKNEARNAIKKLDQRARLSHISPYEKAVIYAGLGEKDEALKDLQKAFDERSLAAPMLRFDPRLNDLRADPRFQDFMRRVGVAP